MLSNEQRTLLATAMSEDKGAPPGTRMDAGYTYFGQFLSHELVTATRAPPRIASPVLDLDSVYGTPQQEAKTYLSAEGYFPPSPADPTQLDDLPRHADGSPDIPETRNDDNVIIAQLHRFWQRLHNFLLLEDLASNAGEARQLVTKVVQLLAVEDFLRQVLAPSVFDSYFRCDKRWLRFGTAAIPPHFSHAAFRFGHSMVRPTYESFGPNGEDDLNLDEVLRQGRLQAKHRIAWSGFFGLPFADNRVQDAMRIDPFVTFVMRNIADPKQNIDIIERNLLAGSEAQVPDGTAYVQQLIEGPNGPALQSAFALAPLPDLGLFANETLAEAQITIANLPLWPYILLEAWTAAAGQHLGVLGSLICAEVIGRAIRQARDTIYDGQWRSVDDVLATLGPLGERLQEQRRSTCDARITTRTLCMRHVIQLVQGSN